MSADRLIASLLRVAKEDLDGARLLAKNGNRNAIYLCEQAAEKVIRAVLTSEGKHAGIRHHLAQMVDEIPDENSLKPLLRAVEHLSAFATSFRYPTPAGRVVQAPEVDQFDINAAQVEEALIAVADGLGVDLHDSASSATKAKPIRKQ